MLPGTEDNQHLTAGKDFRVRDDQVRVKPHLRKMISAKLAARALAKRHEAKESKHEEYMED